MGYIGESVFWGFWKNAWDWLETPGASQLFTQVLAPLLVKTSLNMVRFKRAIDINQKSFPIFSV